MTYAHSKTTRAVLRTLVPVICPPEAAPLAEAIIDHMALTIGASPFAVQKAFGAGMLTYDLGALPRYGRRASSLGPLQAEAYFASWEHGITPLHVQFAKAVNQLMSLSCYEQPAMLEACGYRPAGWIAEVTKKRLAVYGDDVKKQEAQIIAPDPLRPRAKKEVA